MNRHRQNPLSVEISPMDNIKEMASRNLETTIDAIAKLLYLSRMNCGSSRAAANVLLSAYNVYEYPLDVSELCLLDADHYTAAMRVLALRCQFGVEPHGLLAGGNVIFEELAREWKPVLLPDSGFQGEL